MGKILLSCHPLLFRPDGASYGNTGYHLSFSNNRLNLQANKRVKGRITRETLGSTTISELTTKKSGRFSVFAHRERKEFIIRLNDREIARWKDASEDFFPDGNGILFINQGGNSYMRLKELSITGWNGKFFPSPPSRGTTIPPTPSSPSRTGTRPRSPREPGRVAFSPPDRGATSKFLSSA